MMVVTMTMMMMTVMMTIGIIHVMLMRVMMMSVEDDAADECNWCCNGDGDVDDEARPIVCFFCDGNQRKFSVMLNVTHSVVGCIALSRMASKSPQHGRVSRYFPRGLTSPWSAWRQSGVPCIVDAAWSAASAAANF